MFLWLIKYILNAKTFGRTLTPLEEVSVKRNLTIKTKSTVVHHGSLWGVPLPAEEQSLSIVSSFDNIQKHYMLGILILNYLVLSRSITLIQLFFFFFKYQITAAGLSSLRLLTY